MKRFNYYLSLMLLLVFTAACSDEFDQPPMVVPVAEHTPNISIADFKAKHWQDAKNYIDTIKEDEVIHGWITSSDEDGNIYKQIYISDGTAGLTVSIDQSSLYTKYRIGQEVVIPMKGYYIGKFNGLLCLGVPYLWTEQNVWESNRMSMEHWEMMAELNGFPDLSKVDTTVIELSEIKEVNTATLLKYMSRLVRINGVTFADGGQPFSLADESTDRKITDEDGNWINVYNSNYASFRADTLPSGTVDIVGELSYTSSKGFHLLLRSASDVILNTAGGTKSNPFTIETAIASQNTGVTGWIGGYAVGAVGPEVTTVTSNADIEWRAPSTLDNTILLADDPNCKDFSKCVVIPLPQGSIFRNDMNMKDNPAIYQTFVKAKGTMGTYMGMAGLLDISNHVIDVPVRELHEGFVSGIPTSWTNVAVSGGKYWDTYAYPVAAPTTFCAQMRITSASSTPIESWLITPRLDIKNAKSKVFSFSSEVNNVGSDVLELYILNSNNPTTATVKVKLNPILPDFPTSGTYSAWTPSGDIDLSRWADGEYYIGFCFSAPAASSYTTWCVNNVEFGAPRPGDTRADFETMGEAKGQFGTLTSNRGWVGNNCCLFEGGTVDRNPTFIFIGQQKGSGDDDAYAKAPTLNGKVGAAGTIVSPTIHGGMKKLSFSYGVAMSDKSVSFRIDVKKDGAVVESWTVTNNDMVQKQAYSFSRNCNVSGDFTIEITNLCPSASTSNKDRVSIWNLIWEQ